MISVIVPTYNYGRYITSSLSSVLNQTYQRFEVIVIDDGSTDNTKQVVQAFDDSRIKYIYQHNQGACVARNRGVREARGDYLLFEDADDCIAPKHLEEYLKVARQNVGANVYGPAIQVRVEDGEFRILSAKGKCPGDDLLEHWLGNWSIVPNCILWPRTNVERVGGWDETLHANQDGDIAWRALIAGIPFVYADNAPPAQHLRHEAEAEQISSILNEKTIASKLYTLEKVERLLTQKGELTRKYKSALGKKYYWYARLFLDSHPAASDACFRKYKELYGYRKPPGTLANWLMVCLFGLRRKENIAGRIGRYIPWRL